MSDNNDDLELPEFITGDAYIKHELLACENCHGVGYLEKEELYDYHNNEYKTIRNKCRKCNGCGRIIRRTKGIEIHQRNETFNDMPYDDFKDFVDPFRFESKWFRMRLDYNNEGMNRKYPDLAAISYEKYDELLSKYLFLEKIKK